MKKKENTTVADRIARIGAGVAAISSNYRQHAKDLDALAKKVKAEWNGAQGASKPAAKKRAK